MDIVEGPPDPPPPPVLPSPIPTAIQFELARNGVDQTFVVMNFYTAQGVSVFFLETEIAFAVAKQLRSAAQQSQHQIMPVENRLMIPGNGQN